VNVLQNRFQHSTALFHLRCGLCFRLTVILLKNIFVRCLKDEKADSIASQPAGLMVIC
jgi:hypothetical protein